MSEERDAAERLAEHLAPFFRRLEDEGGPTFSAEEHAALMQTDTEEVCRKCSNLIRPDQYRFGSRSTGWEHMAGECLKETPGARMIRESIEAHERRVWEKRGLGTETAETIDNLAQALYAAIDHYVEADPKFLEGWAGVVYFYEVVRTTGITNVERQWEMEGWNITERVLALLDALDSEEPPEDRKRRAR